MLTLQDMHGLDIKQIKQLLPNNVTAFRICECLSTRGNRTFALACYVDDIWENKWEAAKNELKKYNMLFLPINLDAAGIYELYDELVINDSYIIEKQMNIVRHITKKAGVEIFTCQMNGCTFVFSDRLNKKAKKMLHYEFTKYRNKWLAPKHNIWVI